MSEANSALLPANVDWPLQLKQGLINFQLYNKSLKDWSLQKQLIVFLENLNVSAFSGKKIFGANNNDQN